ncbi:hypothetical protein EC973_001237 [Apophysomyces ossiformis]|uniref:Hepatocellular carcinoma-associated antigen 59-domain-containing protein n=1 Tax=Apophysomyces ossiformis TaxID=679940 RepID=A0A8H7BQI5_9FUNG|nr:hypothetical protein EC973_001237 [Apophysomyces ossiformis]
MIRKQRNYRKKKVESDEESDVSTPSTSTPEPQSDVSETIEELQEIRRLRRKHGGIDAEKLFKGVAKKKKKQEDDPWKLKTGGLVDKDAIRSGRYEDESAEKKLKLDSFTTQTNALDVDKHMQVLEMNRMAYIEEEMRKRRGETANVEEDDKKKKLPLDIYEELYKIPDRLKLEKKPLAEGSVQLSTQMLTAIPEVDLGMEPRLQNIEDTERAKRKLMDEHEEEEKNAKLDEDDDDLKVPANFEKQIRQPEGKPRLDRRQTATDDVVAERFKKRMRR